MREKVIVYWRKNTGGNVGTSEHLISTLKHTMGLLHNICVQVVSQRFWNAKIVYIKLCSKTCVTYLKYLVRTSAKNKDVIKMTRAFYG
jgi:hypothetical protein